MLAEPGRGVRSGLTPERTLTAIVTSGAQSRSALCDGLGVSKASISRMVDQLIRRGWVDEGAPFRLSERGRSATSLLARADLGYVVGADLEGSAVRVCLFDCRREVIASRRREVDPKWPADRIVAQWRSLILETIESAGVPREKLIALGLALPGLTAIDAGEVRTKLAPGALTRFDVAESLRDLGVPIVTSDNTLCVSDYERRFGVATDVGSFVSVLVRYGIGAAICSRGRFVAGEETLCSELGHMRIDTAGEPCICGLSGCLDTFAAGRTWPEAAARTGERWDRELEQRSSRLGVGLANLLKIVPSPLVVLNGIYNRYEERVRPVLLRTLAAELEPIGLAAPELKFGDELELKASIGAGLRAIDACMGDYLDERPPLERSA